MTKRIKEISVREVHQFLAEGWSFIDVRSKEEFTNLHAVSAINIPLDQINQESLIKNTESKKIVTICQAGVRSMKAAEIICTIPGYEVVSVIGGTNAWLAEKFDVMS